MSVTSCRLREFGICVFVGTELPIADQLEFLREALRRGCRLVMTSLHLPEMDLERARGECVAVAAETRAAGAFFFGDISMRTLAHFGSTPHNLRRLASLGLDGVRPDYGFDADELAGIALGGHLALVLNASDVRQAILDTLAARSCPLAGAWAIHNYFPRPETGISLKRLIATARDLKPYGLRIGAFVASRRVRRGPLYEGLPTIEDFRCAPCGDAAKMLYASHAVDAVMLADPSLDVTELADLQAAAGRNVVQIRARRTGLPSEAERQVMEAIHTCWGLSDALVRTGNPTLVTAADRVAPRNVVPRPAYSITIDNERYPRFAGTLHVTRQDLPADPRVNLVGVIEPADRPLVELLEPGDQFQLVWVT